MKENLHLLSSLATSTLNEAIAEKYGGRNAGIRIIASPAREVSFARKLPRIVYNAKIWDNILPLFGERTPVRKSKQNNQPQLLPWAGKIDTRLVEAVSRLRAPLTARFINKIQRVFIRTTVNRSDFAKAAAESILASAHPLTVAIQSFSLCLIRSPRLLRRISSCVGGFTERFCCFGYMRDDDVDI